ncbi:MAG: hypothetical protein WC460_05660 [Patescibacteria group bacterium]
MDNSQEQNIKDILDIVTFIKDNAANKEDLDRFATKEDLDGFANKEDLDRFATKEDLDRFATKEDLKQMEIRVLSTFEDLLVPIKQELADIRLELKEIKERLDNIETFEGEDISAAYRDIEIMKKQLADLEIKVQKMQASQS